MKTILLVPDGMADLPMDELGGETVMQAAKTANFDALAEDALVGSVLTVPEGMYPGSDVANMSLLGYDPRRFYTGRGPIEAVAMRVPLEQKDAAFRCSLVTSDGTVMIDNAAGHISTEEARPLVELLQSKLGNGERAFFCGVQYRHILRWTDGPLDLGTTPPHDIIGKELNDFWPEGERDTLLKQLMLDSLELLTDHPINNKRRDNGLNPATMMWLWGQGRALFLPNFLQTFGKRGAVITAVDVVRGLGRAAGMSVVEVPGATGYIDTDYEAKARYALQALQTHDFVLVHVESPDESGHEGSLEHKLRAIEDIDKRLLGTLRAGFHDKESYRVLVVPDHKTPIALKTHESGPVPFLLWDSDKKNAGPRVPFDERAVTEAQTYVEDGTQLIRMLFSR